MSATLYPHAKSAQVKSSLQVDLLTGRLDPEEVKGHYLEQKKCLVEGEVELTFLRCVCASEKVCFS